MALSRRIVYLIMLCLIVCVSCILFEMNWVSRFGFNIKQSMNHECPAYTLDTQMDYDKHESCPPRNLSYITNTGPNRIRIALISFPGSGNTWTRHLIQELTGYYTGSTGNDTNLAANGFPGELASVDDVGKQCIVYKTHGFANQFSKAVILIRNPLDTIKAYFNFLYAWKSTNDEKMETNAFQNKTVRKGSHTGIAPYSLFNSTAFTEYLETKLSIWKEKNMYWLQKFWKNCLVVLYEDLRSNLALELEKIAKFLGVHVQPRDIVCTLKNSEGNYHREEKKAKLDLLSLLHVKQKRLINGAVGEVSDVVKRLKMGFDISQYLM